ncbi:glycosyltransferase family 2 protein [Falsiroseomonas sp.]|uniref:glycosyltransferase family 2 protein n=1 Tax=Falsiroseomonas sp. TaxID=2870721 RepID=UPI0027283ACF|nr:glycosyltransferase family 2 protein [Falsiroseomonas sp.]MDO9503506.1 glycosyltransferase family 2 protein [Falsiroseomonas sp.]
MSAPGGLRIGVIIPARNEAAALPGVLDAILPRVAEVIVVDTASTDGTPEIARRLGARVVEEPRRGYGRACLAGIAALSPEVDTVLFMDADAADRPEDLAVLLAPIEAGEADLVIGARTLGVERGALTPQQRFGNALACLLIRLVWGVRYTDLGPFRVIRRGALARLGMRDETWGWTVEMQVRAARIGLRVVEVPVGYRRRIGTSKISGTLSGTVRAGWKILWVIGSEAVDGVRSRSRSRPRA